MSLAKSETDTVFLSEKFGELLELNGGIVPMLVNNCVVFCNPLPISFDGMFNRLDESDVDVVEPIFLTIIINIGKNKLFTEGTSNNLFDYSFLLGGFYNYVNVNLLICFSSKEEINMKNSLNFNI